MHISKEKVWMKYYPKEVADLSPPKCTAYGYMKKTNKERMHEEAIDYYGNHISYKKLFDMIDEAANAFAALGIRQGDMVSFLTVAVPECIAAVYALNKLGASANMIDPRMDVDSIRRMINESESSVLVVIDAAFPKVQKIMHDIGQKHIIVQESTRSLPWFKRMAMNLKTKTNVHYNDVIVNWDTFLEYGKNVTAKETRYVGDAVVAIAYTGGTTGFPKGVMLTNDSMNAVAFNFKYAGLLTEPGDRFLGIIPIFTSYGMVCGMHMPLCMQMELIPIPKFIPSTLGKLVRTLRPNHMISTPAFYEMMMESEEMQGIDLSFLITMGSGGDTMNEGLERKLHNFMKNHNIRYPLAQGYGMSEVSAAASFCVNDIFKSGSVGIPSVATVISIFDPETGEELGYGERGEICITGPTMMKGYYKRPEETDYVMRMHPDGEIWVHSGDIGYMDEDGFLFVEGRVKRMITRFDGHKVFPVNIESLVADHPSVHNCCVIGVNDRERSQGQYPLVVVQLENGVNRAAMCGELWRICQERLEERGRPVAVLALDEIPLTGSGKNDYRTLEDKYRKFDYRKWDPDRK